MRPVPPRSEPGLHRASSASRDTEQVLELALLAMLVVCGVTGLLGYFLGDRHDLLVGLVGTPLSVFLLLLARRGKARWAAWGSLSFALLATVAVVSSRQGSHDHGILVFPLIIIGCQMLFEGRTANWLSGVTILCATLLPLAEMLGLLKTAWASTTGPAGVFLMLMLTSTTWVLVRLLVDKVSQEQERAFEHEQSYKELFNATTEGIFVHDAETGAVVDVNDSACAMTGMTREELCALSVRDFGSGPDYSGERALSLLHKAVSEGPQVFEWHARRKDGQHVWIEVSLRAAVIQGHPRVLAVQRDIGERKRMRERLVESAKLEAVGRLAGGIAHDFNNQLTGILANAALLREQLEGSERLARHADTIIRCSQRSAELTGQLLAFARKAKRQSIPLDVNTLVADVVMLLERSTDKNIRLVTNLCAMPARTIGDPTLLNSALLNLGLNARDAMPQGGTLTMETSLVALGGPSGKAHESLPPGTYVRIVVSDTGMGMDEPTLSQLFEPFFTTKPAGHGMGLPSVYGTIESHHGAIHVQSAAGCGSRFEILLPHTSDSVQPLELPAEARPRFDGMRVLLAEDEADVAGATTLALEALGCSVTSCGDGRALVERFSATPDEFDVLIVDQVMPGMSGRQAVEAIVSMRPCARILLVSGYTKHDAARLSERAHGFLPKPFDVDALARALQKLGASGCVAQS